MPITPRASWTSIPRRTIRTGERFRCASRAPDSSTAGKGYCCLPVFFGTQNAPFIQQTSASVSYVTGSHALKVGFQNDFGTLTQRTVRQRVRAVLHVQQRRADLDPAARAAVRPDDAPVAGHGHLRAGQVDVQARDDQRRRAVRLLQEQVSRSRHLGPGVVRAEPQYRDPGNALRQPEGHHAARRRRLRSLRQRQDLAQEQLGQVHDRPQPAGRQPGLAAWPTSRTGAGRPACRRATRTTTSRSAT